MSMTANAQQVQHVLTWLNGTLIYDDDKGIWRWCDGNPEPRVFTLRAQLYAPDFMRVEYGDELFIMVPDDWQEPRWGTSPEHVTDSINRLVNNYSQRLSDFKALHAELTDNTPSWFDGVLIPADYWDAEMSRPVGAVWEPEDQPDLLRTAENLAT